MHDTCIMVIGCVPIFKGKWEGERGREGGREEGREGGNAV